MFGRRISDNGGNMASGLLQATNLLNCTTVDARHTA